MHPVRSALPVSALLLAACGADTEAPAAARSTLPPSDSYAAIPYSADVPAEYAAWLPLGGDTLAGLSRAGAEIWTFTPGAPPRRAVRLHRAEDAWAVSAARAGDEVAVLFGDGVVRTYEASSWKPRAAYPAPAGADVRPRALVSAPGGWLTVAEEMEGGRGSAQRTASVVLRALGAMPAPEPFRRPQWTPETMTEGVQDVPSLAARGDTVWLASGHPARVTTLDASLRRLREDTLRDVPRRAPSAADRKEFDAMLASMPPHVRARAPRMEHLPPLRAIARVRGGWLVTAEGPDGSVALDLYCGATFARTVAEGTDLRDAVLLPDAVHLLREYEDAAEYRLERHSLDALNLRCP